MAVEQEHFAQLATMRSEVDGLKAGLSDTTTAVRQLVHEFGGLRESLARIATQNATNANRPLTWQHLAFGMSLVVSMADYMSWWSTVTIAPTHDGLVRVERQLDGADLRVMSYRIQQLEDTLRLAKAGK